MVRKLCVFAIVVSLSACSGANSVQTALGPNPGFTSCGSALCITGAPGSTSSSAVKFFIKGMVYSPTPIGAQPFDSPLKDSNVAIWSRDLPLMRAMGVNAIHVYNVTPPPYDSGTGPITNFLNAAWNGGQNPIYVLMSIFFLRGNVLSNTDATNAIATQYHDLDKKYASYPAVLGVAIGNELGLDSFNATEWSNFNTIAKAAKQGFIDGGEPNAIVTTSEPDGNIGGVVAGEAHGAAVDVWGINIYRGRTFTNLFSQIHAATTKPVIFTEWGASAAYHPGTGSTYSHGPNPTDLGSCQMGSGPLTLNDVAELPASGNPNMAGLVDLVTNAESLMYSGFKTDNVVSGGFYFEWTDEWWKGGANNPSIHSGNLAPNGAFPGCTNDEGWYGLNAVAAGGATNVLLVRPTLQALQSTWAQEP